MNEEFYLHIFNKQNSIEPVPSNQELADWAQCIVDTRNAMASTPTEPGKVWKA